MKVVVALSFGVLTALVAGHAAAYCRATACDSTEQTCEFDPSTQCPVTGLPIAWPSSCADLQVQADGSPAQGIAFDLIRESAERAISTWLDVDCDGAKPALDVHVLGPITCRTSEYNKHGYNANILMFREQDWPYVGAEDTLGLTRIRFATESGEIRDADIELNAFDFTFSVGDPVTDSDLDSVLTHEVGHWLGLAHTQDSSATMFAEYEQGSSDQRTLANDDERGLCEIYPPGRTAKTSSCEPHNGFSDLCLAEQPAAPPADPADPPAPGGCTLAAQRDGYAGLPAAALLLALACFGAGRVKRNRLHHKSSGTA